jgi:hypothetical protein
MQVKLAEGVQSEFDEAHVHYESVDAELGTAFREETLKV